MSKKFIDNSIIKNDLMCQNTFFFSLFLMCIPAIIFGVMLICSIYCFANSNVDDGVKLLVCLFFPIIVLIILGKFLDIKQSFFDYKAIRGNLFEVKTAICVDTKKREFESDGISYEYMWIFENNIRIIKNDSNTDLFNEYGKEGDYLLIFLKGHTQPKLFYNTGYFEYSAD